MIRTHMRRYLAGVLALAAAGSAQSQGYLLERFAGGGSVNNRPALETSVTPQGIFAWNGNVIFLDGQTHRLMQRHPSTTYLTGLPVGAPQYPFERISHFFRNRLGVSYATTIGAVYQLDLATGNLAWVAQIEQTSPTACTLPEANAAQFAASSDGVIYWADRTHHSVCRLVLSSGVVERVAGFNGVGFSGDGGPAISSRLNTPSGIALDASNNVYISDAGNHRIRKITASTGVISTFAGNGNAAYGGENVPAATSSIATPEPLMFHGASGSLYFGETGSFRIRRIVLQTGMLTTIAGNGQLNNNSPDGGLATQTPLNWLSHLAIADNGEVLFADAGRLRRINPGTNIISTIAGNGYRYSCGDNGLPIEACVDEPRAIAIASNQDVYIAETFSRRVRKVSRQTGLITTVAGRNGPFGQYQGEGGLATNVNFATAIADVAVDSAQNVYIAGGNGNRLSRINKATGIITTVAGSGVNGFAGDGGPATAALTQDIANVVIDASGNIFFSDRGNKRVRKVDAATGIITTYAGGGGSLANGIPATSAVFFNPRGLAFDPAGNLLVADPGTFRVLKVDKITGIITTIAGNGSTAGSSDGVPATSAAIEGVNTITTDPRGNLFLVSRTSLHRVDATSGIITRLTTPLMRTVEGYLLQADDMEFDPSGRLYFGGYEVVTRLLGVPYGTLDVTPPSVTPSVAGNLGTDGWYRGDVQVSWTVSDAESAISSSTGCTTSSVTSDTSGALFICSATSEGGTTSQSVIVKRDSVAPEVAFGAVTPAADATGWNSTDVSLPFTANDSLSGVFSTSSGSPLTISGEGAGLIREIIVTDRAGNAAGYLSPAVNIDRTGPTVTPNLSGVYFANGWYNSDAQVSWTVADTHSPITSTEGCDASSVTTDTTGVTFTCTATSTGGSTTKSVTVKRDVTPPTIEFGTPTPSPNEIGWYSSDVSIPFTTSDATSGIASTSTSNPLLIAGAGANLTGEVVVTDHAGNSATFTSATVNIDRSAPSVTASVSGTPGANGWYTGDIHVAWNISDDHAPIDSTDGCDAHDLVADTAGVTFTCTATSAGGSTTKSVTVKRDATPPQLEFGAPSPSPNAVGWFGSDVSFAFDASDNLSGVASTSRSSPVVIAGDGLNLGAQVVVTDGAGNSATFNTAAVSIDRSPPTVQASIAGTVGNNNWYTTDVQVSWAINESPASLLSSNGCGASSVVADTAGVTFTCSVVSGGGTASSSVTVKRDATTPALTFGTPSPVPNASGWNKTNVSISFTRSDAMSGLASTSATSPIVFSTEGAGLTRDVIVTDQAGNTATFATVPRNIDKTVPYAEIQVPEDGATFGFYADVIAQYECVDLSLSSCTGPNPIGGLVSTTSSGARTYKITAKDLAGFTTTHTHNFTVASTFNFDGFLAPANDPPTLNLVTRGSLVPIRWRLPDGHGGFVTNTASFTSATVATLTCGSATAVPLNDTASGPAGISFDAGTSTFTYNWQTTASWTGCRKLTIKLKDNSTHELRFKFQ